MKYDPQMVRDFIDHLRWSMRIEHVQLKTGELSTLQPEMLASVRDLAVKYNVASLLPKRSVYKDRDDLTDEDLREAQRRFRAAAAAERERQLKLLEHLEPLLEHAFLLAAGTEPPTSVNIPASKVLDGTFLPSER